MKTKILLFALAVASFFLVGFYYVYSMQKNYSGKILPNVYIDGVGFSGQTKGQVIKYFNDKSRALEQIKFYAYYKNQPVATFSAQALGIKYDGETAADQAYFIGRNTKLTSRLAELVTSIFRLKKYNFQSEISFKDGPVRDFLTQEEGIYNKPAQNALFTFENGRVSNFRKETYGLQIQSKQFMDEFLSNLNDIKTGHFRTKLSLVGKTITPQVTLSQANGFGIEEEIAEGVSDYTGSDVGRIHNIILAASKFDGVLIPKDTTFSFDQTIGDISASSGYDQAYIIKEGKTVLGDGGGVCQVSTTFFRAALNAGLPIIERHAHAYRVHYYENDAPVGLDATIFSPTVDLKVKNDTPAAILIETEIDQAKNLLYFKLYGKKDGRVATISNFALWDQIPAPPPKYQDDPTLKKGVVKQVDFAASGAKASFLYQVKNGGNTLINETFYSVYQPWQASFLVGTSD